ncbi:radical SAM protein [Actinoplanes sp. M2I2]|uniref:radical SAM protein n=1 Tax=Actinoplanes sp. M2I2 TaxID=1734444 RepID=UPI002022205C|nr:radical SAM protein [Actinoplanes sp. M2I2]
MTAQLNDPFPPRRTGNARSMVTLTDDPPLPRHLQLEITSACNLRCTMCLVSYRAPVNKLAGAMRPELFHRLLADVPVRRLTLQGLGEPLLSPYLMEMVGAAVAGDIRVGFNTNATLLNERRADELVAGGVDWLHVSLDGARPGVYESIRAGATFQTVVDNLAGLVRAKQRAGSSTPWIRVVFVAMRDNVGELPELVRLLSGIGIDEVRVQNLSHDFGDATGEYDGIRAFTANQALWTGADVDRARTAFTEAARVAGRLGFRLRLPALPGDENAGHGGGNCTWPWEAAYITSTGVVQPCCMVMGDDRITLGTLEEQSFPQIWHGAPYREFRRRLDSTDPPDVCRGCSLYRRTF